MPVFGVQALVGSCWFHIACDGVAVLFETEAEADAEIARLMQEFGVRK